MDCIQFFEYIDKNTSEVDIKTIEKMFEHAQKCNLACKNAFEIWLEKVEESEKNYKIPSSFLEKIRSKKI